MANIPKTLEECYETLSDMKIGDIDAWLLEEEKVAIGQSHHGIGGWIRNNWGLWKCEGELYKLFIKNEVKHPDDMSAIILRSYHRFMNKKDIKLEEQIEHSVEYYLSDEEKLKRRRKKKINKIDNDI